MPGRLLFPLLATITLCIFSAHAQTVGNTVTSETAQPIPDAGHDYQQLLSETVDPSSSSVNITLAFPTPKGRGVSLPFSLNYSSAGMYRLDTFGAGHLIWEASPAAYTSGGWSYSVPQANVSQWQTSINLGSGYTQNCSFYTNFTLADLEGSLHNLGLGITNGTLNGQQQQASNCNGGGIAAEGGDDRVQAVFPSNYSASTPQNYSFDLFKVVDRSNGTTYSFTTGQTGPAQGILPSSIEDRNGNTISLSAPTGAGTYPLTMTDSAGHKAAITRSGSTDTVTVGGLAYQVSWSSVAASFTLPSAGLSPTSGYSCQSVPGGSGNQSAISSITLPNGQQYLFYYGTNNPTDSKLSNPYGLINEIIYPTGGWVKYTWKANSSPNYSKLGQYPAFSTSGGAPGNDLCKYYYSLPVLATRTVSFDGTATAQTQTFSSTTTWPDLTGSDWTSKSTTAVTQDLANGANRSYKKTYNYLPAGDQAPPFTSMMDVQRYPLESSIITYDWNQTTTPLLSVYKAWFDKFELACELDQYTGGSIAGKYYQYSNGQVADVKEYDSGQITSLSACNGNTTAPPSGVTPLRETATAFTGFSNGLGSEFGLPSIVFDLPRSVSTYGSGTKLSETDYSYDESSVSSVSAIQHDDTNYGSSVSANRGNVTSIHKKCLSGCSADAVTTMLYDETGQVVSMTDPCGSSAVVSCADMVGSNHTTTYSYTDQYASGSGTPSGSTNAYVTTVTRPVTTNGINHVSHFTYSFQDGHVRKAVDENGNATSYCYFTGGCAGTTLEPLDRLTEVDYPDGGTTSISYVDGAGTNVTSTIKSSGPSIVTKTYLDGLGQTSRTELTSDPVNPVSVDTTYDGVGQVASKTNPHRTSGDPTYGLTYYAYDALGRTTSQKQPDGSTQLWSYSGTDVTFTNENGAQWKRTSDGLGRLIAVLEPSGTSSAPSMETDYSYDALDNLISATQWGGAAGGSSPTRTRTFSYDSLSRLLTSYNPEAGSMCYGSMVPYKVPPSQPESRSYPTYVCQGNYDQNGNLGSRVDARGVATTYTYDSLNRLTGRSYSDSTPTAFLFYDVPSWTYVAETSPIETAGGQTNVIGRLAIEGTNSPNGAALAAVAYSYDPLGRIVVKSTCTPRTCANNGFAGNIADQYDMHYTYDPAGNMTFAGRGLLSRKDHATPNAGFYYGGLAYAINGAGQVSLATSDLATDATHPHKDIASGLAYSPLGGVTNVTLGEEFSQNISYASRGWITQISSTDFNGNQTLLDTSGHDLVGNLTSASDSNLGTFSYCYDKLSRLTNFASGSVCTATSTSGLTYGYDAFGTLKSRAATGSASTYQFNFVPNSNNQDPSRSYDASGHLLSDGVHTYTYDAEGRISTVDNGTQYYYDAEGVRFAEGPVGQTPMTDFLYDLDGHLVTTVGADYRLARTNLYVAGHHWADYTAGTGTGSGRTEYRLADQVGTLVYKFDQSGNAIEQCTSRPFGEDLSCNQSIDYSENHFADKKRDQESNLEYMSARYYGSTLGRFLTPDFNATGDDPEPVPYADPENPQSLNLYSYVGNNPLSRQDTDGHSYLVYDGSSHTLTLYSSSGQKLGSYPANNNVDSRASLGQLPDGSYPMFDQTSPYMHGDAVDPSDSNLQDSEDGEFGPGGIFRVQSFKGPDGRTHRGVGVHAGRQNKPDRRGRTGTAHATQGCIRTCDAAIQKITSTAKTDRLTSLEVIFNRPVDNSSVTTSQGAGTACGGSTGIPCLP